MLRNMTIAHKLILLSIICILPVGLLLYLLVEEQNVGISFAKKERIGVEYIKPIRQLLHDMQEHQVAFQTGSQQLSAKEQQVDQAFKAFEAVDARYGKELKTTPLVRGFKSKWDTSKKMFLSRSSGTNDDASRRVYDEMLSKDFLPLIIQAGNTSNLILDPDLDSYYAMDTVITKLPELLALMGQAQSRAIELIQQRDANQTKLEYLSFVLARLEPAMETMNAGLQTALTENPALRRTLAAPMQAHTAAIKAYTDSIRRYVLGAGRLDLARVDLETFKAEGAKAIEVSYALYDSSVAALDGLLANRIDKFSQSRMWSLGLVGLNLLVSMFFVSAIGRSITRPLANLAQVAERISKGATNVTVEIEGDDEIGQVAEAIRLMQASTQSGGMRTQLQSKVA